MQEQIIEGHVVPKPINAAIMFADITGSTKLYDTLGDRLARAKIIASIQTMSRITRQNNGTVIKTIGDEIMCTFPTAEAAGNAAWDIQETFEQKAETNTDGSPISIRIGMHLGSAIMEDDGDLNGDAVNVAARMAAQAKSKQIITTQNTIDELPPAMQSSSRFVDHAPIKGKKGEIDIFEIIWQEEDITSMATGVIINKPTAATILRVTYNKQLIEVNQNKPSLVMGRSQNCDLMIDEKLASRQHVRIELRRDKFFIVDQSTNGTHIMLGNNPEEFLRREESPINSNGRISLGKKFSENPEQVVNFTLVT